MKLNLLTAKKGYFYRELTKKGPSVNGLYWMECSKQLAQDGTRFGNDDPGANSLRSVYIKPFLCPDAGGKNIF